WKKAAGKQVVLGAFYNNVKDLIDYAPSTTDPNIFILTNVSNSKTAGANVTAATKFRQWTLSAGASYTGFYNDYAETDGSLPELQWSAEANAVVGYVFPKIGLDLNFFYKLTGKRPYYTFNTTTQETVLTEQKGYH